jgi:hypothetical protein
MSKKTRERKTMMAQTEPGSRPDFMERHYTVAELAKAWHMGRNLVRIWFLDQPGVIQFGAGKLTKSRKRTYISLRIPESVARRVYRQHTGKEMK